MPVQTATAPELIERAVGVVLDKRRETTGRQGIVREVGDLLGIHPEALRHWVKKADVDAGRRPGATSSEAERIRELERENAELLGPTASSRRRPVFRRGTRPETAALTVFIDTHRDRLGVQAICRTLTWAGIPVAASTYYAAKKRPPSPRTLRDTELTGQIRRIHEANYGVYRARKVWHQLRREGIDVARCTVERLMRQAGLAGATRGPPGPAHHRSRQGRPTGRRPGQPRLSPPQARTGSGSPHFTYVPTWAGTRLHRVPAWTPSHAGSSVGRPPRASRPAWSWTSSTRPCGNAATIRTSRSPA